MRKDVAEKIRRMHPELVEHRRDLHRHPELAFQEVRTSAIVARWLAPLELEVRTGVAKTGVIARLRGKRPGRTVALRADMDALPIQDVKTCEYASTVPSKMHACGHDAHVTMALGAARILAEMRDEIAGDIVFLFQPAEEGFGGAEPMIAEGALDGVDFILGQHMIPLWNPGEIAVTEGAAMAAADAFTLRVIGVGGHGAYPHMSIDAIPITAQVISALQSVVSRGVDPLKAAVLSIGTINGGYNFNVIADVVEMKGTVRTLDDSLRHAIPKRIEAIVGGITAGYGARFELDYKLGYPSVVNPRMGVDFLKRVGAEVVGADRLIECAPSMGGEDFAYYLHHVPGCFYWVGCKHPEPLHPGYNCHHPAFDLDEASLDVGVQMFVEGALAALNDDRIPRRST